MLFYVRAPRPQSLEQTYYYAEEEDKEDVYLPKDLKHKYLWKLGCSERGDKHLQELAVALLDIVKSEKRFGSYIVVEPHTWHGQEGVAYSNDDWRCVRSLIMMYWTNISHQTLASDLEVEDFGYLGKGFF